MKEVYLIPIEINTESIIGLTGTEGTRVNLLEDEDGNKVVSVELGDSHEFESIRKSLEKKGFEFKKIEYKPKKYKLNNL